MEKTLLLSLGLFISLVISAQSTNEPGNNIGKSLSVMKQTFPNLRYLQTDEKGDEYEDGYPQDGIAVFFYFKNEQVVEECMIIESDDGFPRMWFDAMVDGIVSNYSPGFGVSNYNAKHWCFSTFQVHLIYVSEKGVNTALIIYEKGGYMTGITGDAFYKKYK